MALSGPAEVTSPRRRRPGRILVLLFVPVAIYYAVWGGEYSAIDLLRLREQTAAEVQRLAEVRRDVDALRALSERLEADPATIERVARERFGMIRPGEVLYRFVETDPPAPRQTASRTP